MHTYSEDIQKGADGCEGRSETGFGINPMTAENDVVKLTQ